MLQPIPISAFSIQPLAFRLARVPATVLLLCLGALSALGQSGVQMAKGHADSVSAAFSAEQPAGLRSGAFVQPGERTGCVGCHEHRLAAPPLAQRHDGRRMTYEL